MKLFKRFKRWLMALSQIIKDFFNRLCCSSEPDPCAGAAVFTGITDLGGGNFALTGGNNVSGAEVWLFEGPPPPGSEEDAVLYVNLTAGQSNFSYPGYDPEMCYTILVKDTCTGNEGVLELNNCPDQCAGFIPFTGVTVDNTTFTLTDGYSPALTAWSISDLDNNVLVEGFLPAGTDTVTWPEYDPDLCYNFRFKSDCEENEHSYQVGNCVPDPCAGFVEHTGVSIAGTTFTLTGGNSSVNTAWSVVNNADSEIVAEGVLIPGENSFDVPGYDPELCYSVNWRGACPGAEWQTMEVGDCTPDPDPCAGFTPHTDVSFAAGVFTLTGGNGVGDYNYHLENFTANSSQAGNTVASKFNYAWNGTDCLLIKWTAVCDGIERTKQFGTCTPQACLDAGFPQGVKLYAGLFWAQGYVDTTSSQNCEGNDIPLPSNTAQLFLAFYNDAALTQPAYTSLNNFSVTFNHFLLGNVTVPAVGNGSQQIAYYLGNYPYEYTEFTGFACETNTETYPLPVLQANLCYDVPGSPALRDAGEMNLHRGAGDPTTQSLEASNLPYLVFDNVGPGGSGAGGASLAPGQPGPDTGNSVSASYGRIRITNGAGDPLDLTKEYIITLTGKNSTGTGSEVINVPAGNVSEIVTLSRFYIDQDNPLVITIDEQ